MLRQLRPDQAEVVALRVIAGLTVTETAAVVNKSDGAVRVLCHRGLRALARQLHTEIAEGVTP
jgi:RNA polymerase sigma-70 factor (ECF subfamily)